jgi:hypothetical protein
MNNYMVTYCAREGDDGVIGYGNTIDEAAANAQHLWKSDPKNIGEEPLTVEVHRIKQVFERLAIDTTPKLALEEARRKRNE